MAHSTDIQTGNDKNYNILADFIFCKKNKKPYVFISYKSDDDITVLSTIVYKLVSKYGLRVYFDASFAENNDLWTQQAQDNMDSPYCKGVLAFVSKKYMTSYATLMEIMHSQSSLVKINSGHPSNTGFGLPVVTIDLETNITLDEEESEEDTGLGNDSNINAKSEMEAFDDDFNELCEKGILIDTKRFRKNKKFFSWDYCYRIFKELFGKLKVNQNPYNKEDTKFYEKLKKTIENGIGEDVFDPDLVSKFMKIEETNTVLGNGDGLSDSNLTDDTGTDNSGSGSDIPEPDPKTPDSGTKTPEPGPVDPEEINENMTLAQFTHLCENKSFCYELRKARKSCKAQIFDFLAASLLGGCDGKVDSEGKRKGAYNYCIYVVSENAESAENPKLGASQYTWTSNSRKAMRKEDTPASFFNEQGKVKSGKLGEYNDIFEKISPEMTINCILDKYRNEEKGFITKDNKSVFEAWNAIKNIRVNKIKETIAPLL